jgi:hypothetical protein
MDVGRGHSFVHPVIAPPWRRRRRHSLRSILPHREAIKVEDNRDVNQLCDHVVIKIRSIMEEGLHSRHDHVGNEQSSYLDELGEDK